MKGIRRIAAFDTKKQDAASGQDTSLEKADKTGYLHTYASKTFLGREKWKKRYYVLTGNKLYRFVKKDDASLDLRGASRRRLINLDTYDICQHVNEGECKREHVFILDGANSSIEQTKYVFAADTKEEMQDWTSRLRKAILGGRQRGSGRPQRPPRTKVSSLHISPSVDANDKFISNSLCELDGSLSDEDTVPKSSLLRRSDARSPPLGDRAKSNSSGHLAYQYSSSDDSLLWKECVKNADKTNAEKEDKTKVDGKDTAHENQKISKENNLVKEEPAKLPARKDVRAPSPPTKPVAKEADLEAGPGGAEQQQEHPSKQSVGPLIYMSAKLLEMSACLDRFQRHAKEELDAVKSHLEDVKRRLLEDPPGTTQVDIVARRACIIMTDLKSTEEELETLVNVTQNMQKSLQKVKDKCDEMLNTI